MRTRVMPARSSVRTQRFAYPSLRNTVITAGFAALLDAAGPLAGPLIDRHIAGGDDLDRLLADDAALDSYLDEATAGVWHASGTCRMGDAADPLAVVDPQARVRGIEGLRVCDAAIFPTIPCANTNVPVIMCAEKIADAIRMR